ncbi:hypothetical protein Bbelb_156200 [Branchiostoma belcheri]|nr:hypothetical protein Bbelb_156200 [Branchiostoma belcheri]
MNYSGLEPGQSLGGHIASSTGPPCVVVTEGGSRRRLDTVTGAEPTDYDDGTVKDWVLNLLHHGRTMWSRASHFSHHRPEPPKISAKPPREVPIPYHLCMEQQK